MKKARPILYSLLMICQWTFAQDAVVVKTKDRRMLKIDKLVEQINSDGALIRFISNDEITWAVSNDTTTNHVSLNADSLIVISDYYWNPLSNRSRFAKFCKIDSEIVIISYKDKTYYYQNEKLILSYRECHDTGKDDLQCRPGSTVSYNYYWKDAYYKSYFKIIFPGNCGCPANGLFSPFITKIDGEHLIKKMKRLPLKSKAH